MVTNIRSAVCLVAALSVVAFGSGCASSKLTVTKAVVTTPAKVSVALNDGTAKKMTAEQTDGFKVIVNDRLKVGGVDVVSSADKTAPSLVGEVTMYEPGNRGLRYFIGMGAGAGTLRSSWNLKDGSGAVLGSCEIDGSIKAGKFGGSFTEVLELAGKQLVRFLKGAKEGKKSKE